MNRLNTLNRINRLNGPPKQGGVSWSSYWATRNIDSPFANATSETEIALTWANSGVEDYDGHKIYISTDGISYSLDQTIETVGESATVTVESTAILYWFKIAPYKGTSEGTLSDARCTGFLINAQGNGTSVATVKVEVSADITMTLSGEGRFYDDSGGTTNPTTSRTITAGAMRTFYLKVPSGNSGLVFIDKTKVIKWGTAETTSGWLSSGGNSPKLNVTIADLPRMLTDLRIDSESLTTGLISDLPSTLLGVRLTTGVPDGDVADLPPNIARVYVTGSNTWHGDIANFPDTLAYIYLDGLNYVHGNLGAIPPVCYTCVILGLNRISEYTAAGALNSWFSDFRVLPAPYYGLSTSEVDALLAMLAPKTWGLAKVLNIGGNNGSRSASSDADKATIVGKGVTVTVREHYLDYSFSTRHICTQRGAKVLAFDDGVLSLSVDGGATFAITKTTSPAISIITFAHIFEDGNILFADHTKCYYSDDNLSTYAESTVLGIDGNPFVPGTYNNFRGVNYDNVSIADAEILVWGAYITEGTGQYNNVNGWYSIDSGVTVKSCYKAGVTGTPVATLAARHIHAINFNPADNTFWIQTGDGTDTCNWIKGEYNWGTDAWTWTKIAGDNESSGENVNSTYYKTSGMIFVGTDVYWGSDSDNAARYGIYKVAYAAITTKASYVRVYAATKQVVAIRGSGTEIIAILSTVKQIVTSLDGVTFELNNIAGGPTLNSLYGCYFVIKDKNTDGYYNLDVFSDAETITDLTQGTTMLAKIASGIS